MWPPDMPFADVMAAVGDLVNTDAVTGLFIFLVSVGVAQRVFSFLRGVGR